MAIPALIAGILLIVVGAVGYANATPGDDGKVSPTAMIPALFGVMLAICGLLAFNDKFRKHAMHVAAIVGVLGVLGGFMPIIRQYSKTGSFDPLKPSAVAGELMILICAVFVGLCVNSFIQARRARKAKEATGAGA
jgi:uncharacterized membrane protein HdeD (DUF308 family)